MKILIKMGYKEFSFSEDLILALANSGITPEEAQTAVRALCRHYGGQLLSVPAKKADGKSGNAIHEVIAEATDGRVADAALGPVHTKKI
jgi:hypothetical protein